MHPQDLLSRLRWIEQSLESIRHKVGAIDAQLRVITQLPPALNKDERQLADIVRRQLALIAMQEQELTAALRKVSRADAREEPIKSAELDPAAASS